MKEKKSQEQAFKAINLSEAKANPEYWQVTRAMFREQAARIIQRTYREKYGKKYTGDYKETLADTLSLRFIKEPNGEKASEHAEHIKSAQWTNLDFNDPEFKRNLFKALRLGKINTNQMATAILLYDARILFGAVKSDAMKQHKFNESGPYKASSISYWSSESKYDFEEELQNVPPSERYYFSINISRQFEVAFLFDGLYKSEPEFFNRYPPFINFLYTYVQKLPVDQEKKEDLNRYIKALKSDKLHHLAQRALMTEIAAHEVALADYLLQRFKGGTPPSERNTSIFLIDLMITNEQIPFLVLSPDFNPSIDDSPLLSLILPSMSALSSLMKTVHGEHAVFPYFTTGRISPQFVRYADEEPEQFDAKDPLRPVEIDHPDLIPNNEPHGVISLSFPKEWHDLFHTWRSGANPLKEFLRYIRQVLTKEKGYDMSQSIWPLSDMDFSVGRLMREKRLHDSNAPVEPIHFFNFFLHLSSEFWNNLEGHDDNLILVIDMIIHGNKWEELTGYAPYELFSSMIYEENEYNKKFHHVYSRMKQLLDGDSEKGLRSSMYYILAYRLSSFREGLNLCRLLDMDVGLHNILYWNRNSGLYLKRSLSDLDCRAIEQLDPKELYNELVQIADNIAINQDDNSLKNKLMVLHAREHMSVFQLFQHYHPLADKIIKYSASATLIAAHLYCVYLMFQTDNRDNEEHLSQQCLL